MDYSDSIVRSFMENSIAPNRLKNMSQATTDDRNIRIHHECEGRIENPSRGSPFGIKRLAE